MVRFVRFEMEVVEEDVGRGMLPVSVRADTVPLKAVRI